jgi:hypothetical protein
MATDEELEARLRRQVEAAVWGGYGSEKQVLVSVEERVEDALGEGETSERLLAYARRLLEERLEEEARWSEPTMNDALDRAFEELNAKGILALQNAGSTVSEGWNVAEAAAEMSYAPVRGVTFFPGEEVERGVRGGGLLLVFGSFEHEPTQRAEASLAIAREVRKTLSRHAIKTEWDGSAKTRIRIPPFPWRKRRWTTPPTGGSVGSNASESLETTSPYERALRQVVREEGLTREVAVAALEDFYLEAFLKHYGLGRERRIEAHYDPEKCLVEVYLALVVVEQVTDPAEAMNQCTLALCSKHGMEVELGDELVFQLFYREEDTPEACAQDSQYGEFYRLKTFRNSMVPLTVQGMRDGILRHAQAAARRLREN